MKKRTQFATARSLARRMKIHHILPLLALAACEEPTSPNVVALDLQPAFAVAGSGPMATGSGHLVDTRGGPLAGEPGLRNFSFTAHSDGGVFQVVNRTFSIRLHGSIECLTVRGNEAWFAGTVTESTRPDVIPVGSIRAFYVVDNGEGEGDPPDQLAHSVRLATISAQDWCDRTPRRLLFDIEEGNIQVAGAGAPANGVTTFTDNVIFPIDMGVFIPCAAGGAGEVVILSGDLHSLFHVTINGNRIQVKSAVNPQGISGTGLTTGDKYQGTGVTQETFGGSFINGQFSSTFINNFRIIGEGSGNNLLIHQTFHITVNANGELTAIVDNFSSECN